MLRQTSSMKKKISKIVDSERIGAISGTFIGQDAIISTTYSLLLVVYLSLPL
jgi:hypothetical protein